MDKSHKKVIGAIIVFLLTLFIYYPTIGCKGLNSSPNPANIHDDILLVSLNGEIGRLNVKTHSFTSLYDDIYVEEIVGIINDKELVFLGCAGSPKITDGTPKEISSALQCLYKVDLDGLETTCLAESVTYAYLAPNKEEIAYITFPNSNLEYIKIDSMTTEHIADSIVYFGKSNLWSPDGTKLVLDGRDDIGIFDISTHQYTPLSNCQGDIVFFGWLDKSHLLIKITENNQQRIASFDLKSQTLSYLFNNDNNVYSAMCTKTNILGLKSDSQEPMKWVVFISSQNSPHNVTTLFTIPLKTDEEKFIFFSDLSPISETEIFYRVLESETHMPVFCGIVNLNTKAMVEVDNRITSISEI